MRRLISKQKQQRQDRVKQIIVGSVLIVIMFASVLGYAFQGQGNEENSDIEYNGFEFVKQNNFWILDDEFMFKYNPLETEDFYFKEYVNLLSDFQNNPLYIYSENKEAELEVYKNLYNSVQRIQYACLNNSFNLNCESSWPTKTCENNFILIQEGEFNVWQENNCIFIKGPKENLTKISDEVLFKIIGIKT
ncbi:MAG: hypothetical protein ABFQ65_00420 [Nanoarchaeota archaeon]